MRTRAASTPAVDRDLDGEGRRGDRWPASISSPEIAHAVAGVGSFACSASCRASSISLSFAEDRTAARSIRSSRDTVVSHVQGVKPGRGNASRSTPSNGRPSLAPTITSMPRPLMSTPAGATTCITRIPDVSSPDSSTTSLRSSNWTHQTSPRCTSPPDTGWQADAARARRAVETGAATVDHRCVKTEEHAVAAGHSVNPARWQEAFEGLMSRIAGRFTRVESRRRARKLVLGLLSDLPRKNCWTIAEWAGHRTPDGMQHLLGRAKWDADQVRDDVSDYVVEHLHDDEAVLVVDETGDVKKGTNTVISSPIFDVFAVYAAGLWLRRGHIIYSGVSAAPEVMSPT